MPMKNELKNNNQGFSLVELILTIAILALVTAPFLNSFIISSRTSLRTEHELNARQMGEAIIEEFKGSTLSKLQNETWSDDEGNDVTLTADSSGSIYQAMGLTWDGYNSDYTANVKLTPSSSTINEELPVISSIDHSTSAVFADAFTQNDATYTAADRKQFTIKVTANGTGSARKYSVVMGITYKRKTKILYQNTAAVQLLDRYDSLPKLYLLYTSLGKNDTIQIYNNTGDSNLEVYLICQDDLTSTNIIQAGKIRFYKGSTVVGLSDYETKYGNLGGSIMLHTNMLGGATGAQLKSVGDTEQKDYLYDVDVDVYYKGSKMGSYSSSKMNDKE